VSQEQDAWEKFLSLCQKGFISCTFSDELTEVCGGDANVASVVYYHNKDNALKWMRSKVPALKDKTPAFCARSDMPLLKTVLMSFPC
tara:strand:- start:40738 stop:40998 length:261 start_codon:yes stop_codon:yes gene_type:complete